MFRRGEEFFIKLFTVILLLGGFTQTAFAVDYVYLYQKNVTCDGGGGPTINGFAPDPSGGSSGPKGKFQEFYSRFDSMSNELTVDFSFLPCSVDSTMDKPNGFWLVMTGGNSPKNSFSQYAVIYFDASYLDASSSLISPVITTYVFNGKTGGASFKDSLPLPGKQWPDRILSNHPLSSQSTDWLKDALVEDLPSGARRFKFTIDASLILNHHPFFKNPIKEWFGIGFDTEIGGNLKLYSGVAAQYCSSDDIANKIYPCHRKLPGQSSLGFLKSWSFTKEFLFKGENLTANRVPFCISFANKFLIDGNSGGQVQGLQQGGSSASCIDLKLGEQFSAAVKGEDLDSDNLQITVSGTPSTASFSSNATVFSSGDILPSPAKVNLNWTPTLADNGKQYDIKFKFSDQYLANYSYDESATSCGFSVCVENNQPPSCNLTITDENLTCQGTETKVNLSGANSFDPDGDPLTYTWSTTCVKSNGDPETLDVLNDVQGVLTLTTPGEGLDANCTVTLTVADPFQETSCSVDVNVPACDIDCNGTPNGGAQIDQCGVCGGDGTSCLDCAGVPNGDSVVDLCGVCGGNNECLDCSGAPFGNLTVDRCGVCGGDGTSCLDCNDTDITQLLVQMDGGARLHKYNLLRVLKMIRRNSRKNSSRRFAKKIRESAKSLYSTASVSTWNIPAIITQCNNTIFCVSSSNTIHTGKYEEVVAEIKSLTKKSVRRLRRMFKVQKKLGKRPRAPKIVGTRILLRNRNISSENLSLASQVPLFTSLCN